MSLSSTYYASDYSLQNQPQIKNSSNERNFKIYRQNELWTWLSIELGYLLMCGCVILIVKNYVPHFQK